jgi:glyoxylase-like metal-dependent hydrolase (beta-lactamase superfamily II)
MRIHTIDLLDLGLTGSIAAYLLIGDDGPVLVEIGPSATLETLRSGLASHGFEFSDVRHAVVSHIHFDHAGAAGHLAQHGTTIHVHEFGGRHLIDPSRLIASARRIYGDQMERRWGPILPVPPAQIRSVVDGDTLTVGDIELRAIETPGHARHHHAWATDTEDGPVCFCGDAAATYLAGTDFISLPTPPPEFDPEAWLATLDRLDAEGFVRLYPTHYGAVDDPAAHLRRVRKELVDHFALVQALVAEGLEPHVINAIYRRFVETQASQLGVPESQQRFYVAPSVSRMNVAGMLRYLETELERSVQPSGLTLAP